jgi:phosphatidylinositol alpha-mannosyltransferase
MVCPYDLDVPGGVQEHVLALAAELRRVGDEVVTVGPGGAGLPRHVQVGRTLRVPFNGSVAPIAPGPGAAVATRRALRRLRPDVVHVHEPAVPAVGLAALGARVPLVTTHHAWAERPGLYGVVGPALRRAVAGAAVRIAVSPAAREHHAAALRMPEHDFRVVPNGVDVARFTDAAPLGALAGGPPTVLFVGRLERRKGLEQLVLAFARLKQARPDTRLVVVGDGPERERCEALLPAGLRVDVEFLGRVPADDLPRCYAAADVFVAPALGGESFGIVLLEAMAAGAAVVASDLPGFRSVVDDGVSARLVPPGDPASLAVAIEALLDNDALRRTQTAAATEAVRAYDWPWVTAQVRSVYREAVGAGA